MYRKTKNFGAFEHLPEPMQLRHVRQIARKYKINLQGISIIIDRDESWINSGYTGCAELYKPGKGRIRLFSDAFISETELAKTIYHEKDHLQQFFEHGHKNVTANHDKFEKQTRNSEINYFKELK